MRLVQSGFFDVAQIDILKGPQSLYFGKSATAGVVSIRSAGPTSSLEASLRGSYEFEEKGYTVEGYVSGPISDTLGFRIAGRYNKIDDLYFRSEEHTSELQSLMRISYAVFCLKKKNRTTAKTQ